MQRKQSASEWPGTTCRHRFLTRRSVATLFPQGVSVTAVAAVAVYPPVAAPQVLVS